MAFVSIFSPDCGHVVLADTESSGFQLSATRFSEETGFRSFSHTFTTTGTYKLILGVLHAGDYRVPSGLLVDNVRILDVNAISGGNPIPSPLPAAAWAGLALLGGIGGVAGVKRRLRRDS